MACGASLARVTAPHEQRKTVTVVFCDVTGSTALGERLDPETLRRVMSRYFDEMRASVEHHGGTVEKFIGDAVMAVFGIPLVHEDDALRAVRAAADMRAALELLNKELEREYGVTLATRIGVNTGGVVAGPSGQTLVTGDTVNVAARLEQAAAPGEVLIGEPTHRLVRDAVVVDPVEPLDLKGKAEAVPALRLVSVAVTATTGRARRLDSPMIGRERPLAMLLQLFQGAAAHRACHLFTILGLAGVGKSRLVEEFVSRLEGRATFLRGRCLPYGDGITYFPVLEIVKEAAGLADFDAPDVVEAKVCATLEDDEQQQVVCSRVSQLFGVRETASPEETQWAIRRFLEAQARDRALVVVFDDIHSGEPALLDLIEHVADWSKGVPLFLLCMARPDLLDLRPRWGGGKMNVTTVSLEPLSTEECERLIAGLLGAADLPGVVAERIAHAAEGNPLFVEEMLEMLIDDGRLERSNGSWVVVGEMADVAVPPSISSLLEARLDRLDPDERAVIERASVVGKVFSDGAIQALFGKDAPANLRELVMGLVQRELIRAERSTLPGQETYRFRHLLIRDAAYAVMPKELRAELHERFADWLEEVAGERIDEQEEILAYHLEQAHRLLSALGPLSDAGRELALRAAGHYTASARRASDRSDDRAAATLFRHAADLLPESHPDRPRALYDVGRASLRGLDPRVASDALDEAATAAAASGQRSIEWMARIDRGLMQTMIDPIGFTTDDLRAEVAAARAALEEDDDDEALAIVWMGLVQVEWNPCRFDAAREAAIHGVDHARRSGDRSLLMDAVTLKLATELLGSTSPAEGRPSLDEAVTELGRDGFIGHVVLVHEACVGAMTGDFDRARERIREAESLAERFGSELWAAACYEFGGHVEMMAGDPAAAERLYRKEYELHRRTGDEAHGSTTASYLALALCRLGRFDEAEELATIARRIGADDDLATQASARSAQALVQSARGEHDEAQRLAKEAADLYAGAQSPWFYGNALMTLAEVARAAGRPEEAAEAARAALAAFERKGNEPGTASARALIDEVSAG